MMETGRDLTKSYDNRNVRRAKWQHKNERLRTDLGLSVWELVTTATQMVWLTGLRANLPTPHNSRVIKL